MKRRTASFLSSPMRPYGALKRRSRTLRAWRRRLPVRLERRKPRTLPQWLPLPAQPQVRRLRSQPPKLDRLVVRRPRPRCRPLPTCPTRRSLAEAQLRRWFRPVDRRVQQLSCNLRNSHHPAQVDRPRSVRRLRNLKVPERPVDLRPVRSVEACQVRHRRPVRSRPTWHRRRWRDRSKAPLGR